MVYMKALVSFLAFAKTINAIASPVPGYHEIHERRDFLHKRWTKADRVESHKLFPMRIGLTQKNLDNGHDYLMDVSDPASPNFAKHWTPEEIIEAFRPTDETESEVRNWLVDSGISAERITHSENKGWFAFYATAEEAEKLLLAEYHEYEDSVTGGIIPACGQYHLPKHIRPHVDYITPGVRLLAPPESHKIKRERAIAIARRQNLDQRNVEERSLNALNRDFYRPGPNVSATSLTTCDIVITPACIAALYEIPAGTLKSPENSLGIFESELQFYTQEDLNSFFTRFYPKIPNGTHPIGANIDGGNQTTDLADSGVEVELDLQLSYPIVYPQTIVDYNVDDYPVQLNPNDTYTFGFNTFLDALDGSYCSFTAYNETGNDPALDQVYPDPAPGGYKGNLMCGTFKPTNVISLSYGGQEANLPINYQKRQCLEYLKLGLQGTTFIFASGDSGVSDFPASGGGVSGPTGCLGPNLDIFNPTWPNTCPYVTSVSATKVYPGHNVTGDPEAESAVVDPAGHPYASNFSGGGGFSNIYPIPKWQASAVSHFFDKYNPPYKYYSALSPNTGDGTVFPNFTALAKSTGGIYNRIGRGVPDVAAIGDNVGIYNSDIYRLDGGTSASAPIFAGVINRINEERIHVGKRPIGFLNPSLYANPDMLNDITNGTNPGCNTVGFSAVPGWDPVTGLGSPNYPKMLKYYLSLP